MDPITIGYISGVATNLTQHIFKGALKKIRNKIYGPESQQALSRCVKLAVIGTLTGINKDLSDKEIKHLKDVFKSFSENPDVGKELAGILGGKQPDMEEMDLLFKDAGYDSNILPELPFEQAILTFESVFIAAIEEDSILQPIIQIEVLRKQFHIQESLLDEMRELVRTVKSVDIEKIAIQAGKIITETIGEQKVLYEPGRIMVTEDWEKFYLKRIIAKCDYLDLSAIDDTTIQGQVSGQKKGSIKISDVFTTLFLKGVTRTSGQTIKEALDRNREKEVKDEKREEKEPVPIQAIEAIGAVDRLVILGRPGGGKTTLSNHIAATLANVRLGETEMDEELPGWEHDTSAVPVRIILREFAAWIPAERNHGSEGLVWEYIEHLLTTWGCQEHFGPLKHRLDEEGGIVFFDGLDEVREEDEAKKRSLIVESISAFAVPLCKCKIIVTCREYAYQEDSPWRLPDSGFCVVELDLFKDEQIKAFARTWYMTTGEWKGWDRGRCETEADVLYDAIQSLPHLKALGRYPLLLTLMAQVHGRDGYLPKDRADLYERAVNLLLSHWENRIVRDEKGSVTVKPGLIMQLGIGTDTIRKALENVSLVAHKKQREQEGSDGLQCANIPREDLRQELMSTAGVGLDRAEEIIAYIQERAGLLQAIDNKTFTFPHRTFQEYLAASCIKRMGDFEGYLKDRIREDLSWWREVFLLAAGSSRNTPKNIYELIDALIPNDYEEKSLSQDIILHSELAAQAMDETGFMASVDKELLREPGRFAKIHKRIQKWLLHAITADAILKPAERSSAGTALAKIGDPRFDSEKWFLPTEENFGFVRVEAGEFQMGSDKGDSDAVDREFPRHKVVVSKFYIARYPVTVAQFRVFTNDSGYDAGEKWKSGVDNHPVAYVSWDDASAYCRWLSEKFKGKGLGEVRLPTEAEWEKAARGTKESVYPWGNKPDINKMNYNETGIGGTSPVGCFPGCDNPYGLLDMNGNVDEWVLDRYDKNYYANSPENNPQGPTDGVSRVFRGGSWANLARRCRSAIRLRLIPALRDYNTGIRLVLPRSAELKYK